MKTSEAVSEISKAFAVMQAELKPAAKDAVNPAFRSKYADLAAVWDACRGPLAKNGLFVTQDVTSEPKRVSVTTRVMHITGQWFEYSPFSVPVEKETAHGIGSATSYAKRYSLSAALGVVAENDDDGNAASESTQTKSQAVAARIPPTKEWHPVDGPPPPSDEDRPPEADDDSVRFYKPDGSHVDVKLSGVTAWYTDKYGKFTKGDKIEDIKTEGLTSLLSLLSRGGGDPRYAEMDAERKAAIQYELERRAGK